MTMSASTRMLAGELAAQLLARPRRRCGPTGSSRAARSRRTRTRTAARSPAGERLGRTGRPASLDDHDLAGLDVAHELGLDEVEARTSPTRRPRRRPSRPSDERPEAVRIAHGDRARPRVRISSGVGALDLARARPAICARAGARRRRARAGGGSPRCRRSTGRSRRPLELLAELLGVDQVAVVARSRSARARRSAVIGCAFRRFDEPAVE